MIYAIFKAAGFQYRAELGEVLRLPSLDVESGETVTFDQVLMGASNGETLIGTPTLDDARVQAEVLRHGRADKVIVFKFKRRKNYRKKTGHRQDFTEVRISEIDLGGEHKVTFEPPKKKAKPAKKKTEAKVAEKASKEEAAEKEKVKAKKAAAKKTAAKKTKKPKAKKTEAKKTEAKKPKAKKAEGSSAKKKKTDSKSKKKKS